MISYPRPTRPLFEVIIPTADPIERRLITPEQVRGMAGLSESEASDAVLNPLIDAACARISGYCGLARAGATPATFSRETCRATWRATTCGRGTELLLPWRAPITSVAVTETGVELTDADFQLYEGATLLRLSAGAPACWPAGEIVVDYIAGWLVGQDASAYDGDTDPVPADLQQALVDQVRMGFLGRDVDPSLRSENIPDVWSGSYNFAGGDGIGISGLLKSLEAVLSEFKNWTVA